MKIVAGFLRSPEGRAALERAIEEADLRRAEVVIVHTARDDIAEVAEYRREFERIQERLDARGVAHSIKDYTRGNSPAEDLLLAADQEDADLIVIGVRRRTPVGKLLLGSNAQEVLLNANCPVLTVKASDEDW